MYNLHNLSKWTNSPKLVMSKSTIYKSFGYARKNYHGLWTSDVQKWYSVMQSNIETVLTFDSLSSNTPLELSLIFALSLKSSFFYLSHKTQNLNTVKYLRVIW